VLDAPHLAARGLREDVDERDLARILVGRHNALAVLLELTHERVAGLEAGPPHDVGLDDLAAVLVGLADDPALGDGGVLEQRRLDLERADRYAAEWITSSARPVNQR
jgi:hypothetical protein